MEKIKNKSKWPTILISVLSLALGVSSGLLIYKYAFLSSTERKLIDEYRLLKDDWLYGNEAEYLGDEALAGLLSAPATATNDPYTFYTQNVSQQNLSTSYKGFGISSRYYDGGLYVTEIHDGDGMNRSQAKGKLNVGDIIIKARRESSDETFVFKEHTRNEISSYLNSTEHQNETYILTVLRDGVETEVRIRQSAFEQNTNQILQYPSETNGYTMVIQIDTFLGNPYLSIKTTLENQIQKNRINHLIFDLRGNGGGYVDQAYDLLTLFVKKGTLIYDLVDKNGKSISCKKQTKDPEFNIDKYGIIIDSNSASASEIFTLGMRAGTNCIVYGNKSYGKGIAQNLKQYSDGSVVRYTANYVYGPKRENETLTQNENLPYSYDDRICIQGSGINPDVVYSCGFYNYTLLQSAYDFTTTTGISESMMNFLTRALNYIYPEEGFQNEYSDTYLYTDCVRKYASLLSDKYQTEYLPFDKKGRMSKEVNDKFNKDTYDKYLIDSLNVTKLALGDEL